MRHTQRIPARPKNQLVHDVHHKQVHVSAWDGQLEGIPLTRVLSLTRAVARERLPSVVGCADRRLDLIEVHLKPRPEETEDRPLHSDAVLPPGSKE